MAGTFVASSLAGRLLTLQPTAEWQHRMQFSPDGFQNLEGLEPGLLS